MLKYLLCIIPLVYGFELIERYIPTVYKELTFCESADPILRETTNNVINDINKYKILYLSLHDNKTIKSNTNDNINSICSFDNYAGSFGYTSFYDNNYETDISISRRLFNTKNTLHNVVKHEILHSVGLNHTYENGLMNYSLRLDRYGRVLEDYTKWYMSLDDIQGLRFIRRKKCDFTI
tara:strand:+ start:564 stop:1100 length:537 start_codon:yes stop_codon:yes gene_type:complete